MRVGELAGVGVGLGSKVGVRGKARVRVEEGKTAWAEGGGGGRERREGGRRMVSHTRGHRPNQLGRAKKSH